MTNGNRQPFTLDQVLDAAREAVNEKGSDYIYKRVGDGCTYSDTEGNPSCLVGHVIFKLDPEAFKKLAREELDAHESNNVDDLEFNEWIPVNFWTNDALKAMRFAQDRQDAGEIWGNALYAAENLGADAE